MKHKMILTTDQILFLTACVREYLDDEVNHRTGKNVKDEELELSDRRLAFYDQLHSKLYKKIYR